MKTRSEKIDQDNFQSPYFSKRAELPYIRWHDLRHTYATLLLARGTHLTYVQKSLGHASVQLTLDRYSHWMPSMGRNTADGIDEALGDLFWPSATPRCCIRTQPQRDVGWLHRLPYYPRQFAVQRLQVRLLAQPGGEGF